MSGRSKNTFQYGEPTSSDGMTGPFQGAAMASGERLDKAYADHMLVKSGYFDHIAQFMQMHPNINLPVGSWTKGGHLTEYGREVAHGMWVEENNRHLEDNYNATYALTPPNELDSICVAYDESRLKIGFMNSKAEKFNSNIAESRIRIKDRVGKIALGGVVIFGIILWLMEH